VPETKLHFKLRTALYALLDLALREKACLGSDQFVYWNANDPRCCLAPDVFVYLGTADTNFDSWKTWERGTPELAVEILSANENWEEKLERYQELKVQELVQFAPLAPNGSRLRVWHRVQDALVERDVAFERTPCITLALEWVVAPLDGQPGLRLQRGEVLLPTPLERLAHLEAQVAQQSSKPR
jgi:Uma2 family endonuclease